MNDDHRHLDDLFAGLPPTLKVKDVADLLGMSTKVVYKWIESRELHAYRLGGSIFIVRDELRDQMLTGWTGSGQPTQDASTEPAQDPSQD